MLFVDNNLHYIVFRKPNKMIFNYYSAYYVESKYNIISVGNKIYRYIYNHYMDSDRFFIVRFILFLLLTSISLRSHNIVIQIKNCCIANIIGYVIFFFFFAHLKAQLTFNPHRLISACKLYVIFPYFPSKQTFVQISIGISTFICKDGLCHAPYHIHVFQRNLFPILLY